MIHGPKPFISDIFTFFLVSIKILDTYLLFKYRCCSPTVKVNTVKRAAESSFVGYLISTLWFSLSSLMEEQSVFILLKFVDKTSREKQSLVKPFTKVVLGKPKRISSSTGIK